MKVITWNIRGGHLFALQNEALKYLNDSGADFICLQEIKTRNTAVQEAITLGLSAYPFSCFRHSTTAGRCGVAIFAKQVPLHIVNGTVLTEEGRFLLLIYRQFVIATMYTPNSGREFINKQKRINEWEEPIRRFILKVIKTKPIIIAGDLNVAPTKDDRYKVNKQWAGCSEWEAKEFQKLLSECQLVDCYRELYDRAGYTWGLNESKLRLDYVLVSPCFEAVEAKVNYHFRNSDHYPLEVVINMKEHSLPCVINQSEDDHLVK